MSGPRILSEDYSKCWSPDVLPHRWISSGTDNSAARIACDLPHLPRFPAKPGPGASGSCRPPGSEGTRTCSDTTPVFGRCQGPSALVVPDSIPRGQADPGLPGWASRAPSDSRPIYMRSDLQPTGPGTSRNVRWAGRGRTARSWTGWRGRVRHAPGGSARRGQAHGTRARAGASAARCCR